MTTWDTLGCIRWLWETLGQFGITLELTGTDKDTLGIGTVQDRVGPFRTAWDTWGTVWVGIL